MPEEAINNLTEFQKDALKEIGNIGAGNSATAFAQFLDCKIDMTVPSVEILPISEVPEVTGQGEQKVVGILLQVMGEAPASILFILSEDSVNSLLNIVLQEEVDLEDIDEYEISAVKEIGNILSGSYLSALNQMTGFNLVQSVPGFAYDMAAAILSSSLAPAGASGDYTLLIETQFINGGNAIVGYFFLVPHPGSLNKILKALGFGFDE